MPFLNALGGISSLLLLVVLGFGLARLGWFPEECRKLIPKLVTNVSLPPFLGCTLISRIQRADLAAMAAGALVPMLLMITLFLIAWAVGRLIRVQKRHFGLFCASVSNPNTIFIGIPVNMALFGQEAVPYVLLYYFASTTFFWTAGNYFISRDAGGGTAAKKIRWQNIISPPMLGFILGLFIILLEIPVPQFLFRAAALTGDLTTPLALVFIGITLEKTGLSRLRPGKDMIAALIGRLAASPLIMMLFLEFIPLPELMGRVFIIQSALPVVMQIAILSAYYNTDPEFGSEIIAISTVLSALTIPVFMIFI